METENTFRLPQNGFVFKRSVSSLRVVVVNNVVCPTVKTEKWLSDAILLQESDSKTKQKTRKKKKQTSRLKKINQSVKECFASGCFEKGFEGLLWHVTLTFDLKNKSNVQLGRNPVVLARKVKKLLDSKKVIGFGVLEKGSNASGVFHVHLHVDRFEKDWWPCGFVHKRKTRPNSKKIVGYFQKSFESSEKKWFYSAPQRKRVFCSEAEYFASLSAKGFREIKIIQTSALKKAVKHLKQKQESFVSVKEVDVILGNYNALLSAVTDLFSILRDKPEKLQKEITTLSFKKFAQLVQVENLGTNGYTLTLNLDCQAKNSLYKIFSNVEHSFSPVLKKHFLAEWNNFCDSVVWKNWRGKNKMF